jgi:hypothetical protein
LVGVQTLVSQSVHVIFGCKIHRRDVFRCKGHIIRQVVIVFILFPMCKVGLR